MDESLSPSSTRLQGKKVALCVTGSVAAVETVKLARELRRKGAEVRAFLSRAGGEIVGEKALEFATSRAVVTEITGRLEHLEDYDLVLVAPATANTISKMARGIGDTPPTLLVLSSLARVMVAPAMHHTMYRQEVMRRNMEELQSRGVTFVPPLEEEGAYKLAPQDEIVDHAIRLLSPSPLKGARVVVTAGATLEPIDEVRAITSRSSGRMGVEIAKEAFYLGGEVTLVHARVSVPLPRYLKKVKALTIEGMAERVEEEVQDSRIFISAAAVGDFNVGRVEGKLDSRKAATLDLYPAPKVLSKVTHSPCFKVGFKAFPREGLAKASRELLEEQGLDLVVANDVKAMGGEENEVLIVSADGEEKISLAPKSDIATAIFQQIVERLNI